MVNVNSSEHYRLGRNKSLLEWLYARNFTTDNTSARDVSSSSLSSVSSNNKSRGRQEFVSCNCKRDCIDKKCYYIRKI